jgi:hypothetical protein
MIQEAIFDLLTTDPILSTLLDAGDGTFNVYPIRAVEGASSSLNLFVTYQRINESVEFTCPISRATYQINAVASDYAGAQDLAKNIIRVLQCYKGTAGGQEVDVSYVVNFNDLYDNGDGKYFVPIDVRFVYKN